jgi:hypothetical protein
MNLIQNVLESFNEYAQFTDFQQFCIYNSSLTPLGPNNTFESLFLFKII